MAVQPVTQGNTKPIVTGNVLDVAMGQVGVARYCWAGTNPPCFDCSGFVYWCFNQIGVPLQRAMSAQLNQGSVVPLGAPGNRLVNAVPGDVVYFGLNNADPAKNHEGIITSTVGIGSMVNAACTACGPIRIDPIGEGSASDEPISAIRRFTLGMPGTVAQQTPQAQVLSDTSFAICKVKVPVADVCLWYDSWGRAALGGLILAVSFATAIAGITLLAIRNKWKIPAPMANATKLPKGVHSLVGGHVYFGDVPETTARGM